MELQLAEEPDRSPNVQLVLLGVAKKTKRDFWTEIKAVGEVFKR